MRKSFCGMYSSKSASPLMWVTTLRNIVGPALTAYTPAFGGELSPFRETCAQSPAAKIYPNNLSNDVKKSISLIYSVPNYIHLRVKLIVMYWTHLSILRG